MGNGQQRRFLAVAICRTFPIGLLPREPTLPIGCESKAIDNSKPPRLCHVKGWCAVSAYNYINVQVTAASSC
eukprot:726180-Amphidinium_carterae.1